MDPGITCRGVKRLFHFGEKKGHLHISFLTFQVSKAHFASGDIAADLLILSLACEAPPLPANDTLMWANVH